MSNTFLLRITTVSLVLAASSVIFTNPVRDVRRVLLRESRSGMEELRWSVNELPRDFTDAKHDVLYYWRTFSNRLVVEVSAINRRYASTEKPVAGPQTAQIITPGQRN